MSNESKRVKLTDELLSQELSRRELLTRAAAAGMSFAGLAALAGESPVIFASPARSSGTLVVASGSPEITLDPGTSLDGESILFWRAPYENLLEYDRSKPLSLKLVPHLAESFHSSPDGLTHTLKLRRGVTFTDGTHFNAAAVRTNIERIVQLKVGLSFGLQSIRSIHTPDDRTVVLKLSKFEDAFLSAFAGKWAPFMISPRAISRHAKHNDHAAGWLSSNMVGTGPYMLSSYTKNQEARFKRNPRYWRGWTGSHFDQVIITDVTDPSTERLLLQRDQADVALFLPDDVVFSLTGQPNIRVTDFPSFENYFLVLPCHKGPTAKTLVRQAISYGFDYEGWIKNSMHGKATQSRGMIAKGLPGYSTKTQQYDYNPTKAKHLLAQAGYPRGGFTIPYIFETGYWWKRPLAELFQSNMKDLGITVTITEVSPSALFDLLSNPSRAHHAFGFVLHPLMARPYDDLQLEFSTAAQGKNGLNWAYYSNKSFDRIIEQAVSDPNPARRAKQYERANNILVHDAPAIWVMYRHYNAPMRSNLRGYRPSAMYEDTLDFYSLHR